MLDMMVEPYNKNRGLSLGQEDHSKFKIVPLTTQ